MKGSAVACHAFRYFRSSATALAAATLTAACSTPAPPPTITMVQAAATLEDTSWELVKLGDAPVVLEAGQRAPYIVLTASDRRVSGFAGCNRLMGGYTSEGAKLSFTQLAGTMMACAQGMELEQALHAALAKVAGWRLEGNDLTLLDASGKALASFRSG